MPICSIWPGVHQHHPVGDLHGLLLVVRDEDRRHVDVVVEAAQPRPQLLADAGVERAEGLVEQEDLRLDGERPRERHPLPLAAGELRGVAVGEAVQLHEREQLVHAGAHLALRTLADGEPERDVLEHRHVLERRVVLEHHADAALLRSHVRGVLAEDLDSALVGLLEAGDHPEERRLAAPARAEEGGQRPARDRERYVVESDEATEALGRLLDRDCHAAVPFYRVGSSR